MHVIGFTSWTATSDWSLSGDEEEEWSLCALAFISRKNSVVLFACDDAWVLHALHKLLASFSCVRSAGGGGVRNIIWSFICQSRAMSFLKALADDNMMFVGGIDDAISFIFFPKGRLSSPSVVSERRVNLNATMLVIEARSRTEGAQPSWDSYQLSLIE